MFEFKLGVLLLLCHFSLQKSTPQDDSYVAAVVEFKFDCNVGNMTEYLKKYLEIIKKAADQDADIVVFPEGPHTGTNPDQLNMAVAAISAAAKKYSIYVVFNLREYVNCSSEGLSPCRKKLLCPGKQYSFNTDLAIDRNGTIIQRTSQYHLFGEPELTAETCQNVTSFKTDFGVEFGTVISYDVFFTVPTGILVTRKSLNNIIMTSKWYSELPFLTSIETYLAFQSGYNINLLAAGANSWKCGYAGSAICSGNAGALVSIMQEVSSYKLLIAKVPKTPGKITMQYPGPTETNPAQLDGLPTLQDTSLDKFITKTLKPGYQEVLEVYKDITCKIIVNITLGRGDQFYRYRAAVFSGVRNFGFQYTIGARACAVIACTGDDIYSCGKRFPKYNKTSIGKFFQLKVIGTAPTRMIDPKTGTYDSTFFKTSSTSSLSSVQPQDVDYKEETKGRKTTHTLSLKNLNAELYTFGFWGRKFRDDGKSPTTPRVQNVVESMVPTSECPTSANETPQGGLFTVLKEIAKTLSTLKKLIQMTFGRNR